MSRLSWKRSLDARTATWSPEFFRKVVRLGDGDRRPLGHRLLDWQARDFQALDRAWLKLAAPRWGSLSLRSKPLYQRAYLERPRGHSKTFDTAIQLAWILIAARQPLRGLCAAADRDQALLVLDAMTRLARRNEPILGKLQFRTARVLNPVSGSRIEFLTSDVASSWGHDPDLVVCDELCHWPRAELWHSLASSAAKRPHCVLLVLSNAGVGRDWHWQVRETARTEPGWYFSSLAGPQAPWITEEQLAAQRLMLPRALYERLWLNIWQDSDGGFVSLAEAEACRDDELTAQARGLPQHSYVAAIDYAEKHDLTVGCVCHRDGDRVLVDRLDVVRPTASRPTPVQWVFDWMERIARDFRSVRFVVDDYQLVGVVQQLERRHLVKRFAFKAGRGNHALALLLRRLIVERQLAWYPGCGTVIGESADEPERDDLETELSSLLLRQSQSGHLRIDHIADARHHDDRSFALGAACLELMSGDAETEFIDIRPPRGDGTFAW